MKKKATLEDVMQVVRECPLMPYKNGSYSPNINVRLIIAEELIKRLDIYLKDKADVS